MIITVGEWIGWRIKGITWHRISKVDGHLYRTACGMLRRLDGAEFVTSIIPPFDKRCSFCHEGQRYDYAALFTETKNGPDSDGPPRPIQP